MAHATSAETIERVCVKLYGPEPEGVGDQAFVPVFHEWIREGELALVAVDVADYAHVPDGPGIMLLTHETAFALDRSDGRFGLLAQRRISTGEVRGAGAVSRTLGQALELAALLERDPRLAGRLAFRRSAVRVEANDRLRAPNSEEGYRAFEPLVRAAVRLAFPGRSATLTRVPNDPRDRLGVDVRLEDALTGTTPSP